MLVNSEFPAVQVPQGFASDGQIVLNISPSAVRSLHMDNEAVSFEGRFGGVPHSLYVPIGAILGIYARENGQGMVFELESPLDDGDDLKTMMSSRMTMARRGRQPAAASEWSTQPESGQVTKKAIRGSPFLYRQSALTGR
jgi:stringent starvation protein B